MKHDTSNICKASLSTFKKKSTDDNKVSQKWHEALIQSVLRLSKRMLQIVNNFYAVICSYKWKWYIDKMNDDRYTLVLYAMLCIIEIYLLKYFMYYKTSSESNI